MAEVIGSASNVSLALTASVEMYVLAGALRWTDFDSAIQESSGTTQTYLRVDGTLFSAGFATIDFTTDPGAAPDTVIVGTAGAVHATLANAAIAMTGQRSHIVNQGQVSGGNAISLDGGLFAIIENTGTLSGLDGGAIRLIDSNSVQIINSGVIMGESGIRLDNSYAQILNSGSITGTDANSAAIDATLGSGSTVIRNSGRIEGPVAAIRGSAGFETVVNTGAIFGDVMLAGGNDVFRGRQGQVEGDIYGGGGNDQIASGRGDDNLRGGSGNDTLAGDAGDDRLFGESGNDILAGGEGVDLLYGGVGNDDFVFDRRSGSDRVADFVNGQDQIDVSAFDFASIAALRALAVDRPAGLLINFESLGGGTVTILGLKLAQFDASDAIL